MEPTKKCKKCYSDIHPKATICPNCRSDLRCWFRKRPIYFTFLFIFTIFQIIILISISKIDFNYTYSWDQTINNNFKITPSELCKYSQNWVEKSIKQRLPNPNSLKIPKCSSQFETQDQYVFETSDGWYTYSSYYLSTNSSWWKLRSDYSCTIQFVEYPSFNMQCSLKK